jgi:hypothetical protein
MVQAIAGIDKNASIQLPETPSGISASRVVMTLLGRPISMSV